MNHAHVPSPAAPAPVADRRPAPARDPRRVADATQAPSSRSFGGVLDALIADGASEQGPARPTGPVPLVVPQTEVVRKVSQGDGDPPANGSAPPTPTPTTPPAPTSYKIVAAFTFTGAIGAGGSADPFGIMRPTLNFKNCTARTAGDTITLSGTIDGTFLYAWNAGGRVDVPTGTAAVVTTVKDGAKKVWEQIRDDLMPMAASPHKSPRSKYWSEALTIRHERFHAQDFHDWVKNTGTPDAATFLATKTPASNDATVLGGLLGEAKTNLENKMYQYYFGGASDPGHSARAGEITAYADGKPEYQALAEAVEKQGKALEAKEAEEKAKAPPKGDAPPPSGGGGNATPPSGGQDAAPSPTPT